MCCANISLTSCSDTCIPPPPQIALAGCSYVHFNYFSCVAFSCYILYILIRCMSVCRRGPTESPPMCVTHITHIQRCIPLYTFLCTGRKDTVVVVALLMHPYLYVMYAPIYMYICSLVHIFVLINEEASPADRSHSTYVLMYCM